MKALPPLAGAPAPRASADEHAALVRGLGLMTLAMLILPVMDAIAKLLSETVAPGQITLARFGFQTLFTLPLVVAAQGWNALLPNRILGNAARGALLAVGSVLFFLAVKYMPLADALAIFFVEPFILTILSAWIGKEKVGWRRKLAVAAGFLGALIVIRPSYGVFGPAALLPLASGCLFAVYLLLNRRLSAYDSPLTMQFSAGLAGTFTMLALLGVGMAVGEPNFTPSPVTAWELGLLAAVGLVATFGHLLVVQAFRAAHASLLAPFQYLEIVSATILGYVLFGDFPDPLKWLGIAIIVASGVYVFWRESRSRPAAEPGLT